MSSSNGQRRPSFYKELIKSFGIILIIFLILFSVFATKIIFTRLETNINSLLDKSLTIAWEEYEKFQQKSMAILSYIAAVNKNNTNILEVGESLHILNNFSDIDFWCLVDNRGKIITNKLGETANSAAFLQLISEQMKGCWQNGEKITSSELVPISQIQEISPSLAEKASVIIKEKDNIKQQYISDALFQVSGLPLAEENNKITGAIIIAHLLNSDNTIANNYSQQIPNSFLSISTNGVRIAANIHTNNSSNYVGSTQTQDLIEMIKNKKRYFGQVKVAQGEIHFVASDPILNIAGQVIGALTVGVPSQGLASLKKDTIVYILISAFICLIVALGISFIVSRRFSSTIVALGKLAQKISKVDLINLDHITLLKNIKTARIREIWYLQQCFNHMANSLYEKTQENIIYLDALEKDRCELQRLTLELQEMNQSLEKKVADQTKELQKAVVELKSLNSLKSKFLANMSHEIRTPLNSIIGFSEMLYDGVYGELNSKQKEYIEIILGSAKHLLELINDILDLSLVEQNKIILYKQKIDPGSLITSVETIIRTQVKNRNLSLKIYLEKDLPLINVDSTRIKQVLYNLMTNSIKFTPSGGIIKVSAYCCDNYLKISVQDTGIGIKKEHLENIFDEFYQADNIYERKYEGVGLGLPLSKRLIELHNGYIEISSIHAKGTIVDIYLPLN